MVPKGSRASVYLQTVRTSYLWDSIITFKLSSNERIKRCGNDPEGKFADFILNMGDGKLPTYNEKIFGNRTATPSLIRIPHEFVAPTDDLEDLLHWTYPHLREEHFHSSSACVLTPLNTTVDIINSLAINAKDGEMHHKLSADSTETRHMPTEYINSISPPGCPPHDLELKDGCTAICLRNIDPSNGLVNGARLLVEKVKTYSIEAKITNGTHAGKKVSLFRIDFESDATMGFVLKRRQYPIKLCYAMTINKSQRQTIPRTSLYLPDPVFSHGQLYVAFSRCGDPAKFRCLVKNVKNIQGKFPGFEGVYTRNIVYAEVLT